MTIDTIISDLRERLGRCAWSDYELAANSARAPDGVSFSTRWLRGFRSGEFDNPQVRTLKALDWVLSQADQETARRAA